MKLILFVLLPVACIAQGDSLQKKSNISSKANPAINIKEDNSVRVAEFDRSAKGLKGFAKKLKDETSIPEEQAATRNTGAPSAMVSLDVNGVKITLHRLVKFTPAGSIVYKVDNTKFDYYVMDVSILNNTKSVIKSGQDFAFNIDIESKKGQSFQKISPSVKALTLFKLEKEKVDQAAYERFWGNLKPGEKAQTILKGFEVPKGTVPGKFIYYHPGTKVRREANL